MRRMGSQAVTGEDGVILAEETETEAGYGQERKGNNYPKSVEAVAVLWLLTGVVYT